MNVAVIPKHLIKFLLQNLNELKLKICTSLLNLEQYVVVYKGQIREKSCFP